MHAEVRAASGSPGSAAVSSDLMASRRVSTRRSRGTSPSQESEPRRFPRSSRASCRWIRGFPRRCRRRSRMCSRSHSLQTRRCAGHRRRSFATRSRSHSTAYPTTRFVRSWTRLPRGASRHRSYRRRKRLPAFLQHESDTRLEATEIVDVPHVVGAGLTKRPCIHLVAEPVPRVVTSPATTPPSYRRSGAWRGAFDERQRIQYRLLAAGRRRCPDHRIHRPWMLGSRSSHRRRRDRRRPRARLSASGVDDVAALAIGPAYVLGPLGFARARRVLSSRARHRHHAAHRPRVHARRRSISHAAASG